MRTIQLLAFTIASELCLEIYFWFWCASILVSIAPNWFVWCERNGKSVIESTKKEIHLNWSRILMWLTQRQKEISPNGVKQNGHNKYNVHVPNTRTENSNGKQAKTDDKINWDRTSHEHFVAKTKLISLSRRSLKFVLQCRIFHLMNHDFSSIFFLVTHFSTSSFEINFNFIAQNNSPWKIWFWLQQFSRDKFWMNNSSYDVELHRNFSFAMNSQCLCYRRLFWMRAWCPSHKMAFR